MKHELSACILIPTLAVLIVPTNAKIFLIFLTLVCVLFLASMQSYSYACTIESMLFLFAQAG